MPPFRTLFFSLALAWAGRGAAQEGLELKPSLDAAPQNPQAPVVIDADRMQSQGSDVVEAFGNVEVRTPDEKLNADYLRYTKPGEEVYARGRVRAEKKGAVITGTELRLNLDAETGYVASPVYTLPVSRGRGDADRLLFEGENRYRLRDARYTTCPVGNDDWYLEFDELDLNRVTQVGRARNAHLEFKGVPLLYSPFLTFPLTDARKTGLLAPSFGTSDKRGTEFTLPFYWNIASNLDATLSPRLMTKRGLQLGTQIRYLAPSFAGNAEGEILPNDQATGSDRYAFFLQHQHALPGGWAAGANIQGVSDDFYFSDLSDRLALTSQVTLPRELTLARGAEWGNLLARVQRFQTLQDPNAPILPPYERVPQLLASAARPDVFGLTPTLTGEFTSFRHPTLTEGTRAIAYPSVSLPLATSYGFLTPKVGVHATHYSVEPGTALATDPSRVLPISSLDGGLIFERDLALGGRRLLQTLEPRLFYLYVPYRDQSGLPNFDSTELDFNFTQIFTENRFSGGDRINDANQVTMAVTTRFLEADTGIERLRAAIGQRYYFEKERVTLASPPRQENASDLLALVSGQVTPSLRVDTNVQYDPDATRTARTELGARFSPDIGRVLNASYRFRRDNLEQIDVSGQWPLSGRWYGLARYNYSLKDGQILEGLAGVEYNAACWSVRAVAHRFVTATADTADSFFLQLELTDLGRLGSNPLDLLRQNIPGYVQSNQLRR